MIEVTWSRGARFVKFAASQDLIGWRRFMEGVILKELVGIQQTYVELGGGTLTAEDWTKGLILKLLETMHGQWLYRNVTVHDATTRELATKKKVEL